MMVDKHDQACNHGRMDSDNRFLLWWETQKLHIPKAHHISAAVAALAAWREQEKVNAEVREVAQKLADALKAEVL